MTIHSKLGLFAVLITGLLEAGPAISQTTEHQLSVTRLTSDSTKRKGGSGGSQYNLSCLEGRVLIGIKAWRGSYIDRVQGICHQITDGGEWTGNQETTNSAGGSGGEAVTRTCPSGYAISGFSGRAGSFVNRLVIECTKLGANGTFDTSDRRNEGGIGANEGGTSFGTTRCDRPARSIVGRSGSWVDSFELACEDSSPLITRSEIDQNLSGAEALLTGDSGTNDVACDVGLNRNGRVRIEPSNGLYWVSSQDEFNQACSRLGFVLVTKKIKWCGRLAPLLVGCSRGDCMVVIDRAAGEANTMWAHEFGHTRGLPDLDSNSQNVMYEADAGGDRITQSQCDAYRSSAVSGSQGSALMAQESSKSKIELQDFVSLVFIEGLPYERTAAYGPGAVPELIAVLRDPRQETKWANAAVMLAMIGGPDAFEAVTKFIKDPGPGEVTPYRNWARENALMALGYSANTLRDKQTLTYLRESLKRNIWKTRGVRGAIASRSTIKRGAEIEDAELDILDNAFTQNALIGLALSGTPEGKSAITAYFKMSERTSSEKEMLKGLLQEHALVAQKGIVAYDKERQLRAGQLEPRSTTPEEPPPPDTDDNRTK